MVLGISLDTLLSLPFFSFLIFPSIVSNLTWGSSLNFVFFYLTWATVVWSHQPLHIELFGALAIRTVFYLLPCTLFLLLDLLIPSIASEIKVHGNRALPQAATRSRRPARMFNYVGVCLFNVLLGVALQTVLQYILTNLLSYRAALRITTTLPMPVSLAKDITRAYLVRGPLTYYIHRYFLHSSKYSPTLSRWHRTWQHTLTTTLPFSASYDHPAVYLLYRWLPVYLPAALFNMHMLTYLLFLTFISLEEAFAWSGYRTLPSTIMLAGMARRTEAHMMTRGPGGNFGPWGVMDWAHGTSLAGNDVMDDLQEEAIKRNVRGKAKEVADRASNAAGELLRSSGDDDEGISDDAPLTTSSARARVSRALRRKK